VADTEAIVEEIMDLIGDKVGPDQCSQAEAVEVYRAVANDSENWAKQIESEM
jgi:hypothetical protein